jgi:hypothetical protein
LSFIILPGVSGTDKCRLAYDNLLEQGTVTASSEDADYPVENCYDWNTADYFRPAASGTVNIDVTLSGSSPANYLAFYNQDLYLNAGTIKLQYWNGSAYVDATTAYTPADNSPRVIFFDSQTSTKWRVVIACSVVFNIGVLSFGQYLAMQYGRYLNWAPPVLGRSTTLTNNLSDAGMFLGRSIVSKGISTNLILQYAQDSWVRANWLPFIKHVEQKPFFWVPNADDYPNEAVLCWTDGDTIPPPQHLQYGYMGATLAIRGLVE